MRSLHAPGPARLGLDIGVLDEPGLELAFHHRRGPCDGCVRVAADHTAAHQDVAGAVLVDQSAPKDLPLAPG